MKVDRITTQFNATRQHHDYAETHLAPFPNVISARAIGVNKFENGIFTRYLEKENGQRDLVLMSSTRERQFLELRHENRHREELFQRLNYKNGVHYSVSNTLHFFASTENE